MVFPIDGDVHPVAIKGHTVYLVHFTHLFPPLKLLPLVDNVVKVVEHDFPDFPSVPGPQTVSVRLRDVEPFYVDPLLTLHLGLMGVHMNRLIAFIGVEEESPAQDFEYGRHGRRLAVCRAADGTPAPPGAGFRRRAVGG